VVYDSLQVLTRACAHEELGQRAASVAGDVEEDIRRLVGAGANSVIQEKLEKLEKPAHSWSLH
jgi:hypothetical protein